MLRRPDPATQSAYSDPGAHLDLVMELPDDIRSLEAAARNVIVHYRAQLEDAGAEREAEVNARWLDRILAIDRERFGSPLLEPRPLEERVAGCCRDHTLFVVGALRARGVPARSRVGFARYLAPDWTFDHVVVEMHDGQRWVRTDPELEDTDAEGVDVDDLGTGRTSGFISAADAWLAHREGDLDVSRFGVFPDAPPDLTGPSFVRSYVIVQVAHRYGDELLLWDLWGSLDPDGEPLTDEEVDHVASLLARCDLEDDEADDELYALYRRDARLHPGGSVLQASPLGTDPVRVELTGPG